MKMTRGTNLMQQLWFIIINISTCFGHLYAHLQEYRLCAAHMVFSTRCCGCGPKEVVCSLVHCVWVCIRLRRIQTHTQCTTLHTTSLGPQPQHLVLNTICAAHNLYSWRWAYRCPKHVEIFMIINHNCCINLVPLVIFIHDARSHIHQIDWRYISCSWVCASLDKYLFIRPKRCNLYSDLYY